MDVIEQLNSSQEEALEAKRQELLLVLDRSMSPGRVAWALSQVGLTAADLAIGTCANKRTTGAWLSDPLLDPKKKIHQVRLQELKEVVRFIIDDGTIPGQEADWLRYPNRSVDFKTPLILIGEGKWMQAGRLYCEDVAAKVPELFMAHEEQMARAAASAESFTAPD